MGDAMNIDHKLSIERKRAREDSELNAFEKMNCTMKRMYIQQLIRSYETHTQTAKYDDQAGYHFSANIHRENAADDLLSLRSLLSEVRFNDVMGEL